MALLACYHSPHYSLKRRASKSDEKLSFLESSKMSFWATLNRSVFKRTSTFALVVAGGTFFFERTFELISVGIFESINKGKLWKDIEHKYQQ